MDARGVMVLNDQESTLLATGLLAVWNTTTGDFIVINLRPETDGVGFVSHDELWESSPADVRSIYVAVDRSIHALLAAMSAEWHRFRADDAARAQDLRYPLDYDIALLLGLQPAGAGDPPTPGAAGGDT